MAEKARRTNAEDVMKAVQPYLSRHRTSRHKFSKRNAALLVIDMQRYFLEESSHAYLPDSKRILSNVKAMIASCRDHSIPIVFTRHAYRSGEDLGTMGSWWNDSIRDGTKASDIDYDLNVLESDKVIRKTRYSAFEGTDLERWLRSRRVSQIVITGVLTHLCCDTTARDAFMRGFDVFFVVDGTASSSRDLHNSSIKCLTDGFVIPVTSQEMLRWIG